jgi:hypothetical protein
MKNGLFASVLLLAATTFWPSASLAQNHVCPTAPLDTNKNQCASTAFVQQSIAGGVPLPRPFEASAA